MMHSITICYTISHAGNEYRLLCRWRSKQRKSLISRRDRNSPPGDDITVSKCCNRSAERRTSGLIYIRFAAVFVVDLSLFVVSNEYQVVEAELAPLMSTTTMRAENRVPSRSSGLSKRRGFLVLLMINLNV